LAHCLHWRLISKKVAAVNGVVEMLPGRIAFTLQVLRSIDPALCADGMRALDWDYGEQVHMPAHFGNLDDRREPGKAAADNDDFWISCHSGSSSCTFVSFVD